MDIYVARQPIFDRSMNVYGYELLYRSGTKNIYDAEDGDRATAQVIHNAFFALDSPKITEGKKAFINFTENMLLSEIPLLLPAEQTVIEILETVEISRELVDVCKKFKEAGFLIALDDFVVKESYEPIVDELIGIVDIIKVDFLDTEKKQQYDLIKRFKNRTTFLAEKVETFEQYYRAKRMGYRFFQGYFFARPIVVKNKSLDSLNINLSKILYILSSDDPEFTDIAEVIKTDIGLTYKLLRLANSVVFGTKEKITSILSALVRLGLDEIEKWMYLLILIEIQDVENRELIKTCLIRAKFMELFAEKVGLEERKTEYFLAGVFSSIDILLNDEMENILSKLVLTDEVRDALMGINNPIAEVLDLVRSYEVLDLNSPEVNQELVFLFGDMLTEIYIKAVDWVAKLNY